MLSKRCVCGVHAYLYTSIYLHILWKKRWIVMRLHASIHSGTRTFAVTNLPSAQFQYPGPSKISVPHTRKYSGTFHMQQHCSPYSRDEGVGVEMIGSQNGNENVQLI